jgi:methionine-rich copper-binding protein CopC
MTRHLAAVVGIIVAIAATGALGHSMMKGSAPPDGAVLTAAPEELVLEFSQPVRLTAVKLVPSRDEAIALAIDRTAPAASSAHIVLPRLMPDNYRVSWSALSQDGHPMSGSLSFTITEN